MTIVMSETKPPSDDIRLSVDISPRNYERLSILRATLRRKRGKNVPAKELCAQWIEEGLGRAEAELAAEDSS